MKNYLSIFVLLFMLLVGFGLSTNVSFAATGAPECSDGVDNDSDGTKDFSDPQCHAGGVVTADTYLPLNETEGTFGGPCATCGTITPPGGGGGGNNERVCSDKLDNDGDKLVDDKDPGCHTDGDVNNPVSYQPFGNSEANTVVALTPAPQVLGATTTRPTLLQRTGGRVFPFLSQNQKAVAVAKAEVNSLSIPKLGINKPILQLEDIKPLRSESWMVPWGSTPEKGGNTIIVGHSYNSVLGKFSRSTFYDLDKMEKGDELTVTWKGKNYTYVVTGKGNIKPEDIWIEDPTTNAVLTIYGCGKFENKTRNYVRAELKS